MSKRCTPGGFWDKASKAKKTNNLASEPEPPSAEFASSALLGGALTWGETPDRAGWWWLVIDEYAHAPQIARVLRALDGPLMYQLAGDDQFRLVRRHEDRRWAGPIEIPPMPVVAAPPNGADEQRGENL